MKAFEIVDDAPSLTNLAALAAPEHPVGTTAPAVKERLQGMLAR